VKSDWFQSFEKIGTFLWRAFRRSSPPPSMTGSAPSSNPTMSRWF